MKISSIWKNTFRESCITEIF